MLGPTLKRKTITITMRKRTFAILLVAASALILSMVIWTILILNESKVVVLDSMPNRFLAAAESLHFQDYDFVQSHELAAAIARAHIKAFYGDSFSGLLTSI
jgi:hypothetical protein